MKGSEIVRQLMLLAFDSGPPPVDVTMGNCLDLYARLLLSEAGATEHSEGVPELSAGGGVPPPKTMTGRGSREKRDIHRRLAEYRAANGLGCYEALAKAAGGKLSADEIRMMALGEAAFPLNKWMALGSALEKIGANEGNRHHDGGH